MGDRRLETTIVGALPKLPEPYEHPDNIRRAIRAFEAGRIDAVQREAVTRATQARALQWQRRAGVTLLGDGQVRWEDAVSPLCLDVANLEPGGLLRFFQNNTYYRQPVVTGRLWLEGRSLAGWAGEAAAAAGAPLKASLPGPYTVARLSEDRQYRDLGRLTEDVADVLGILAGLCLKAGAEVVDLEEPSLARETDGGLWRLGLDAVARTARLAGGPVHLTFYFGDATPRLADLVDLPVEGVSFDLVEGPDGWDRLAEGGIAGRLGLGVLNARDLRPEPDEALLPRLEAVAKAVPPERLWLHPNTALEYLPADGALRKLERLGSLAQALCGQARSGGVHA
jgi:5-methyltetrahydropteroyltriglutamate--homocysteine methyltransferase